MLDEVDRHERRSELLKASALRAHGICSHHGAPTMPPPPSCCPRSSLHGKTTWPIDYRSASDLPLSPLTPSLSKHSLGTATAAGFVLRLPTIAKVDANDPRRELR